MTDQRSKNLLSWTIKHKVFVLISITLSLLFGFIYSERTQQLYQREATVMLLADQYGNNQIDELVSFAEWDFYKTGIDVFNEIELLQSPLLMEKVVEKLGLHTSYTSKNAIGRVSELYTETPINVDFLEPINEYIGAEISSISFDIETNDGNSCKIDNIKINDCNISESCAIKIGESASTPMGRIKITTTETFSTNESKTITVTHSSPESVANEISKRVTAKLTDRKSTVINLSIIDTNPKRAEDILSNLIDTYDNEWINYLKESAENSSKFIDEQLGRLEKDLGISADYFEKSTADQKIRTNNASKRSTYNKLSTARLLKERINDSSKSQEMIPENIGIESNNIKTLITEYNKIISSHKGRPIPEKANNQLEEIRESLSESLNDLINSLSTQAKGIADKENVIASHSGYTKIEERLYTDREKMIKEELYIYLLEKREESELSASISAHNTRMLKPATGPKEPISPKKEYIMLLALIFGIAFPYVYRYLSSIYASTMLEYRKINNTKN